jgi:hypothetical protein
MGVVVASVVGVLLIALVAYLAFVLLGARASATVDEHEEPRPETLRYDVPEGQDPVVVMSALRRAGYEPTSELVGGSTTVIVPCPSGAARERARVRDVVAGASETTLEGPEFDPGRVIFEDEKSA